MVKKIDICFITNDNAFEHTLTCMKSLLLSKKPESVYAVHVILDNLSKKDPISVEMLALAKKNKNFKVNIYECSSDNYPNYKVRYANARKTAFIKFDIAKILNKLNKVLYVDQDMIFFDDISSIFDLDLHDLYMYANPHITEESKEILSYGYLDTVYNSGFMLLNLKKMRDDNVSKTLFETRSSHPMVSKYWLMDQLAFNVVFKDKTRPIPPEYNHILRPQGKIAIERYNEFYGTNFKNYNELFDNVCSIHVASPDKPWNPNNIMNFCWKSIQNMYDMNTVHVLSTPNARNASVMCIDCGSVDKCIHDLITYDRNTDKKETVNCFVDESVNIFNRYKIWYNVATYCKHINIKFVQYTKNAVKKTRNVISFPVVSVIVPVYNTEKYLTECLDSVLNQSLKDIEIICVNDGSTDNSLKILKEYEKRDNRIKIINNRKNSGAPGIVKNQGIAAANGEYIGFVDSDDWIDKDYFAELYKIAKTNNADMASGLKIIRFNSEREWDNVYNVKGLSVLTSIDEKIPLIKVAGSNCIKLYRNLFVYTNKLKCWEQHCTAEDNYLSMIAMLLANKIAVTSKVAYHYRKGIQESVTGHARTNKDFNIFDVYLAIDEFINQLSISQPIKDRMLMTMHLRKSQDLEWFKNDMDKKYLGDFKKKLKEVLPDVYGTVFNEKELIISLTSYPARIGTVNQTIESLLNQTKKADKVILWLAPEQFPNREKDLPKQLLALRNKGLTIDWYHDIRSYKKLIPVLQKYPNAIIITADDDLIYQKNWVKQLYTAYTKKPNIIWCHRAHRIVFNRNEIKPYRTWKQSIKNSAASYLNFCTTGGGVLYPPHTFDQSVFDEDTFIKLCPYADDIWFWAMSVKNKKKIQTCPRNINTLSIIEDSQEEALWHVNCSQGYNDVQLKNVIQQYPEIMKLLLKENTKDTITLKPYALFPYYAMANMWMKVIKIPYLKFKKHIKQIMYSHSHRGKIDVLNTVMRNIVTNMQRMKTDTDKQIALLKSQQIELMTRLNDALDKALDGVSKSINQTYADLLERETENSDKINTKIALLKHQAKEQYMQISKQFTDIQTKFVSDIDKLDKNITNISDKLDSRYKDLKETSDNIVIKTESQANNLKTQIDMLKDQTAMDFNKIKEDRLGDKYFLLSELHKCNTKFPFVIPYKKELEQWYTKKSGSIDIRNPRTFNEKIQWLKLFDSTPIKTRLADKYLVREWVSEQIGDKYLIPLLGVYNSFDEIDFDKLPNQFVIKCNHGSGYNMVVKDKSKLNLNNLKQKVNKWLAQDFAFVAGCELHYRDIPHKILIEKYVSNDGKSLWDYKFWCFNGKVKYMQFRDDFSSDLKMVFYDLRWHKQPFYYDHPLYDKDLEKPDNFDEMVKIAEKLCQGFAFVCVDLYRLNNGEIKFGEMTFTRSSGIAKWNDEKYNKMLGDLIKLPKKAYNIETDEYYDIPKS